MWFLECDEDIFDQKRLWLRPGTVHLFGRTRQHDPKAQGKVAKYLAHSSISRQHLTLTVDEVKPGDSTHLHTRSKITLTDASKIGTTIDGLRINKESKVLDKSQHTIRLGNYETAFRIKWEHVVFSFTSLPKKAKNALDPLATERSQLEPLDIKCITEYMREYTSHTVAKKRNTAFVLQSLVNAKHIVTQEFIKAVVAKAKKPSVADQSPLEQDFGNWPKESEYLPPAGNEPNPRPANSEEFAPNADRSDMFARYSFIFNEAAQYESLMGVVNGGSGKALLREVDIAHPEVNDVIDYVKEVAGEKGNRSFTLSQAQHVTSRPGGIVVVRIGDKSSVPGFYEELDQALGQRSMEQNEFLDAILKVDASGLKQPLRDESIAPESQRGVRAPSVVPSFRGENSMPEISQDQERAPSQTASGNQISKPASSLSRLRSLRRPATQPRFGGFDMFAEEASKYQPPAPSQDIFEQDEADSHDVMDIEHNHQDPFDPSQQMASQARPPTTKRAAPAPLEEERETNSDVINGFLKGAATMKRRKLEQLEQLKQKQPEDTDMNGGEVQAAAAPLTKKRPRRRKDKELDVQGLMRERRAAEEEARQHDEENLRTALDGLDVSEIRNLVQIQEMDIVRREPPPRQRFDPDGPSDRWDDRWNGRQNFKKFRRMRNADGTATLPHRQRVIVPLEEVRKKTYGVGDEYWLEPIEEARRKETQRRREAEQQQRRRSGTSAARDSRSQTQRSSHAADANGEDDDDDEDDANRFRRRIRNSRVADIQTAEEDEILPEEIAGTARDGQIEAAARASSRTQHPSQASTLTQTLVGSGNAVRKRPAATQSGTAATGKRRQTKAAAPLDNGDGDSDSDDGLRFRRRR